MAEPSMNWISASEAIGLVKESDGNVILNGSKVRVFKRDGQPDVYAVVDVIKAIKGCTYNTAKNSLWRLQKEHEGMSQKFVTHNTGTKFPCQCCTSDNLIFIIGKLKHPLADKIAFACASSFNRIVGGDQRLHDVIDAARAEQERLAVEDPQNAARACGQFVEADGGATQEALPGWASDWRELRSSQKDSGKRMQLNVHEKTGNPGTIATVNNYANQGVLCFEGTTAAFKRENGIGKSHPMAAWMNQDQLNLRRMMQNKISEDLESKDKMTDAEVKRKAREHRDFTQMVSKYYGLDKFDADHYEQRVKKLERRIDALEDENAKTNKRLRTLERRAENASVQTKSPTVVSLFTNFNNSNHTNNTTYEQTP